MLKNVKQPKNLMQYSLMRGVTDYGNLAQFDLFEKGYSGLAVLARPKYIETLGSTDQEVRDLLENFCAILECEFRGLDGIPDITAEAGTITNGITELQIIQKVTEDTSIQVSMRFWEKSGSTITKFTEYYLRGIKDPKTQAKHYHGLIQAGILSGGYENEVFTLLYYVTDNTYLQLEKAYLLLDAQLVTAETSMYNSERGQIDFQEVTVTFNCFPVTGDDVNLGAKNIIDFLVSENAGSKRLILDSNNFKFTGIDKINTYTTEFF